MKKKYIKLFVDLPKLYTANTIFKYFFEYEIGIFKELELFVTSFLREK